ncbi:MAG: hypothetical protein LBK27_02080 [Treponema sp.]|jgi:hypothetical protein|nr:hypothetical protein [Treponema sp.]
MKNLYAALALGLGLVFSGLCFAQTQTGNASYNAAKTGVTISHPSMSFGTRVKITNLRNNSEVIATVDGRIPASDPRVADISAEAGDAIGMSPRGYTEVRLEQLIHLQPQAGETPPDQAPSSPGPAGGTVGRSSGEPGVSPAVPPPAVRTSSNSQAPENPPAPVPGVFPPQPPYLAVTATGPGNCFAPPCAVILVLLIVIVLLLAAILVWLLSLGRTAWWFRRHSSWVRRHFRSIVKRRHRY